MYGGRCAFDGCTAIATEIHHALVRNSKYHKSRHPLLTDSPFNKLPLCRKHHQLHPSMWNIGDMQADIYEKYLSGIKEEKGGKKDV